MDENMPKTGVDELIRIVQPAYKAAGRPEHFRAYQPDSIHVYTKEYFEWMVKWLERYC